jgi:hypothetical protein
VEQVSTTYAIPDHAQRFTAAIGNDDNQPNPFWNEWHLIYDVIVDGRTVYQGYAFGAQHDTVPAIDVSGGHKLQLAISRANSDAFGGTEADWGDPAFH